MKHFTKRMLCLLVCTSLLFTLTICFPLSSSAAPAVTPMVSVGNAFTVALNAQGQLFAWGDHSSGTLGIEAGASSSATPVPISVVGVTFKAVSAGFDHVLALTTDGKVYAWGNNESGQLGLDENDFASCAIPTLVADLAEKTIVAVSAGKHYSLALTENGDVYAFGLNDSCQLGVAGEASNPVPMAISELTAPFITKIEAGPTSAVAIDSNGHAYVWGKNDHSQLGNANSPCPLTRLPDDKITQAILQVAVSELCSAHLLEDGTVGFMGSNQYGQYGNGSSGSSDSAVFKVTKAAPLNIVSIAVAKEQTVLLTTGGTVYTAGKFIGNTEDAAAQSSSFTPFFNGESDAPLACAIDAAYRNGALIAQDGSVWMWGDNECGQLGNGTQDSSATPVRVCGAENAAFTLGEAPRTQQQQMQIILQTTVPSPDYAVTIPASFDVGTLRQTTANDPQRYSNTEFPITVSNVENLFGEQKIVLTVSCSEEQAGFYLSDLSGTKLPYGLYLTRDGTAPLTNGATLAEFTQDESVSLWIRIDQSKIQKSGTYSGSLTFDYSVKPIAEGGAS